MKRIAQNTQKPNNASHALPFFLIAFFFSVAMPAQAQWRKVASGVFTPYKGWFLNLVNNHGVLWASEQTPNPIIGILYSLDTGKTWSVKYANDGATKFDFYDSLNGLMTLRTLNSSGTVQLWSTSDGGANWNNLTKMNAEPAAIFAGSAQNIVAVNSGITTSTDGGATVSKTFNGGEYNDIAFSPPSTVAALQDLGTSSLIISTDKGLTWIERKQAVDFTSALSLGFDRCDPSVLYVVNQTPGIGPKVVYITKDLGVTLQKGYTPGLYSVNGSVTFSPNAVFFQMVSGGIVRTTDQGATWTVIGGPSQFYNNRGVCALSNNTLVAVDDNGDIWRTDNSGGFPIISPPPITSSLATLPINECNHDSLHLKLNGLSCHKYFFTKIWFVGNDTSLFSTQKKLPIILDNGGSDSLTILIDSKQRYGALNDSIKLTWYDEGEGIYHDTAFFLPVTINPLPPNLQAKDSALSFDTTALCAWKDSVIMLKNFGCDTLNIISGPGVAGRNFNFDSLQLPLSLPPDSVVFVHVHFRTTISGQYTTSVQFTAEHRGLTQQITFPINAIGNGPELGLDFFRPAMNLLPVTSCAPSRDTTIYIVNTSCDTLQITSGPNGLGSGFSADPIALPQLLLPGNYLPVRIHFRPSGKGYFFSNASFTADLDGNIQMKSIPLSGQSIGSNPALSAEDTAIDFGFISLCIANRDTIIKLFNSGCDTLTLVSGPGNLGNVFSADSLVLPILIPKDSSITIHYHFHPTASIVYNAAAIFTATANGQTQTITQNLTGQGSAAVSGPVVSENSFTFDTTSVCSGGRDTTIEFVNHGCDTLIIISGPGVLTAGFQLITALKFPVIIPPQDTVKLTFHFKPNIIGKFTSTPKFRTAREGVAQDVSFALIGFGNTSGTLSLDDPKIDFGTVTTCTPETMTSYLINNICDSLLITEFLPFSGSDFLKITPPLPAMLHAGDSLLITITFAPTLVGAESDSIIFTGKTSAGKIQYLPLHVFGFGEKIGGLLSYSPKQFAFRSLSICDHDTVSGYITNSGCDLLKLDPWQIFSDPDFQVSPLSAQPSVLAPKDTMDYKVYLDPAAKGLRQGMLVLTSHGAKNEIDSIPFTCIVHDGTKILSSPVNALDFGTTKICDEKDTTITLSNTGCDTLKVESIAGLGASFGTNANFPIYILPHSDTTLHIFTMLDTAGGATSNTAMLDFLSDADNTFSPVTLSRSYSYPPPVHLWLDADRTPQPDASIWTVKVKSNDAAISLVSQIDFTLSYNSDLLEYIPGSGSLSSTDGKTFHLRGNMQAASDSSIGQIDFRVYLTTDTTTDILFQNITLNAGDPKFMYCSAYPLSSGLTFDYRSMCGDPHIRSFMRGEPLEFSIRPNPAQDEIEVDVQSPVKRDATIEIYDALGAKVYSDKTYMSSGISATHINTKNLAGGVYIVRIGTASQSFVKVN